MVKVNYSSNRLFIIALFFLSFAMHSFMLSRDLVGAHVWRQTETQTVINNFATEDHNILNPRINGYANTDRIHRMEVPIMQWVFSIFFRLFGQHIIISRLLSLAIGFLSTWGIFLLCNNLFRHKYAGIIGAWVFSFSPLFYYYTVNPLPDNLALCCCIYCLYYFIKFYKEESRKFIILSGLFLCLASMAKLPFILYCVLSLTFLISRYNLKTKSKYDAIIYYALLCIPSLAWYVWVIPTWGGNGVIKGIFDTNTYNASDITHILYYTVVSLLPETILNYGSVIFFIASVYFVIKNRIYQSTIFTPLLLLTVAALSYYIYEMNMITLVHDYYLMPFLPILFLLVTYGVLRLLLLKNKVVHLFVYIVLLSLPILAAARMNGRWNTNNPGFNPVYYSQKEVLRKLIPEGKLCVVGNDYSSYILLYYLDRKGWSYDNNNLNEYDLNYYISCGAEYLITDCNIDTNKNIKAFLDKRIYTYDNVELYKLKRVN